MEKLMLQRISVFFIGVTLASLGGEWEAQSLINQAEQASKFGVLDVKALIQSLKEPEGKISKILNGKAGKACMGAQSQEPPAKCGMNLKAQEADQSSTQLYIFVSSSLPQESIRTLAHQAQKIGAHVVFRGLVGGTFLATQNYMKELGITAEIDPPKFEDYKVTVVPTFILASKQTIDRVTGHISLFEALDQFGKKGDLKAEAHKRYQTLRGKGGKS
jgi:type-F conjugative transfer system pilin assembly protein TrbC